MIIPIMITTTRRAGRISKIAFTRGVKQKCSGQMMRRIRLENAPAVPFSSSLKTLVADPGSACMSSSSCNMLASTNSSNDWMVSSMASTILLHDASQPSEICERDVRAW